MQLNYLFASLDFMIADTALKISPTCELMSPRVVPKVIIHFEIEKFFNKIGKIFIIILPHISTEKQCKNNFSQKR